MRVGKEGGEVGSWGRRIGCCPSSIGHVRSPRAWPTGVLVLASLDATTEIDKVASRSTASHHILDGDRVCRVASDRISFDETIPLATTEWCFDALSLPPTRLALYCVGPATNLGDRKKRLSTVMQLQPLCALDIMCVRDSTAPTSVAALHTNVDMPSSSPARKLLPYSR